MSGDNMEVLDEIQLDMDMETINFDDSDMVDIEQEMVSESSDAAHEDMSMVKLRDVSPSELDNINDISYEETEKLDSFSGMETSVADAQLSASGAYQRQAQPDTVEMAPPQATDFDGGIEPDFEPAMTESVTLDGEMDIHLSESAYDDSQINSLPELEEGGSINEDFDFSLSEATPDGFGAPTMESDSELSISGNIGMSLSESPKTPSGDAERMVGGIEPAYREPVSISGDMEVSLSESPTMPNVEAERMVGGIEPAYREPVSLSAEGVESSGAISMNVNDSQVNIHVENASLETNVDDIDISSPKNPNQDFEDLHEMELEPTPAILDVEDENTIQELQEQVDIDKMETLNIIDDTPEPELPEELVGKKKEESESDIFDSDEFIISIDGDELDRAIYGENIGGYPEESVVEEPPMDVAPVETLGGVGVIEEEPIFESDALPMPVDLASETLIATESISNDNFELIVEDNINDIEEEEIFLTSEPTEVLQESQAPSDSAENVDFNFDLSAIPDVGSMDEDEDEPIALSMEELNNIEVSEDAVAEGESGMLVAETQPMTAEEKEMHFESPMEEEIEMSETSLEEMAKSEDEDDIRQEEVANVLDVEEPEINLDGADLQEMTMMTEETGMDISETPPLMDIDETPIEMRDEAIVSAPKEDFEVVAMPSVEEEMITIDLGEAETPISLDETPMEVVPVLASEAPATIHLDETPMEVVPLVTEESRHAMEMEVAPMDATSGAIEDVTPVVEIEETMAGSAPAAVEGASEDLFTDEDDDTVEISLEELEEIQEGISNVEVVSEAYNLEEKGEATVVMPAMDSQAKTQIIEEKLESLSDDTKNELKTVLSYLDNLLENLPPEKIQEFAKSNYYDLYVKILDKLGI